MFNSLKKLGIENTDILGRSYFIVRTILRSVGFHIPYAKEYES